MNDKTKRYLKFKFQKYYQNAEISVPSDYTSREWGFIPFNLLPQVIMKRHKAFHSKDELKDFLQTEVPAHIYHSVAYYKYPDASNMNEKHWLKADLIFDLDADHLPNAQKSYVDMLNHVKKEATRLLYFLQNDFGFKEEDIKIVFSGSRGYHFHITDNEVLTLGSHERREIVDYIHAIGLDIESVFNKKTRIRGDAGKETADFWKIPSENDDGWKGQMNKYIVSELTDIAKREDAMEDLMKFNGIGEKKAQMIINSFTNPSEIERFKKGEFYSLSKIGKSFFEQIAEKCVNEGKANTDEPVTTDIKRLIRLPGSLHGKTGMCVKIIPMNEFENFDPLNDTIVFGDEKVELKVMKPFKEYMKNILYEGEEGIYKLPEYISIYLMCKGIAEYGKE